MRLCLWALVGALLLCSAACSADDLSRPGEQPAGTQQEVEMMEWAKRLGAHSSMRVGRSAAGLRGAYATQNISRGEAIGTRSCLLGLGRAHASRAFLAAKSKAPPSRTWRRPAPSVRARPRSLLFRTISSQQSPSPRTPSLRLTALCPSPFLWPWLLLRPAVSLPWNMSLVVGASNYTHAVSEYAGNTARAIPGPAVTPPSSGVKSGASSTRCPHDGRPIP